MTPPVDFNRLTSKREWFVKQLGNVTHPLLESAIKLLTTSDYAVRQMQTLSLLLREDDCQKPWCAQEYEQFVKAISLDLAERSFADALRSFRHRHLLRLCVREYAHLATTEETMAAWSDCADAIILHTLDYSERLLARRYGQPCDEFEEKPRLSILAMGKLGGRELNFSSDIDLIFVYNASGYTKNTSGAACTNQQFYTKVVQHFMQTLQTVTANGFVFRVDLRLRPNGESGALASSYSAMETYYQEQGRDWERYAMVKARLVGGDKEARLWFARCIVPFVYRRYVDFSVIDSLRGMKGMMEREIQSNPSLNDIKRGKGGIREIEFIIQCGQLIRGGRLPQLQLSNALAALRALHQEGLLAHTAALREAYLFFRALENHIQIQNDQQTHALPSDEMKQMQLVFAMGYESYAVLLEKCHQYQRIVEHVFRAVLGGVDAYQNNERMITQQLAMVWQGQVETTMASDLLEGLGFSNASRCYQLIYAFRHAPRCRRLSQSARLRLDRFMVLLLAELSSLPETDAVLLQVLRLLEQIVSRSAYLALFTENPAVLKELLHWFAKSPFITSLLVNYPFLLEVLVDQSGDWRPSSRRDLAKWLRLKLAASPDSDKRDEVLRQFKLSCWVLAARAELQGLVPATRIGRYLSDLAEVIIAEVIALACERLQERFPDMARLRSQLTVIAYGKLGSSEMNYDSDVDLVFLHRAKPSEEAGITRFIQKILHMLTTRTEMGVLYAVDTRLRPSGSAGLLVSRVEAFLCYQREQAWTWEHQAILRARLLHSNKAMFDAFYQLKKDILQLPRDTRQLAAEIQNMRAKMGYGARDEASVKYAPGGLLDLEFLVQFLLLANPRDGFVDCTNTLSQLKRLYENGVLSRVDFLRLQKAYRCYHVALHQGLLLSLSTECVSEAAAVTAIGKTYYACKST